MKTKTIIYAKRTPPDEWQVFKHGSRNKISAGNLSRTFRSASTLIDDREHVVAVKIEVMRKK